MSFYCMEKAKGRGCDAKETLGIPQCHYCYEYQRGYVEPTSPVPVVSHSDPTIRAINDPSQWYSNTDGWWNT